MKISIIVPIYKVEPYLRQCVDSVLNQSWRDFELILVDDGSPDKCPQICDEYAAMDARVKVIHKANGGSSDARNAGIRAASGEYGLFLDSDDFWNAPDALEHLTERLSKTKPELLTFPYYKLDENTGKITAMNRAANMPVFASADEQIGYLFDHGLFIASAWNKAIAMRILKEMPFEVGRVSEDVEWCARILSKANNFDYIDCCFYCYRQRVGSIAHSIGRKSCVDLAYAIENCCKIAEASTGTTGEYLRRYAAYQYATFIAVQAFTESFERDTIQRLIPYASILRSYGNQKKVKYMYYGIKSVGMTTWCRLMRATKFIWDKRRNLI